MNKRVRNFSIAGLIALAVISSGFVVVYMQQGGAAPLGADVLQVNLPIADVETYGAALADQVAAGDGNGVDMIFRNSAVLIDGDTYYGVNGVHPVQLLNYSGYYPKSIVAASLTDDRILRAYSFSAVNGRDVDMEALTFAEAEGMLYIGDEYNFIYELNLETGDITREWNLADVGVRTATDKGIEALTYSPQTGYFYAGIQGTGQVIVLSLSLAEGETLTQVAEFPLPQGWAPSGLYAHSDGTLYAVAMSGNGQEGNQKIFRFEAEGELLCAITIPSDLGIVRPDGINIDEANALLYIADSQGPLYDGASLYRLAWTDPCR
ncbi:MAG: esterase-like activity of phytase family protein [Phototrophicaceae bacterium]|jgi:hypothetical protein